MMQGNEYRDINEVTYGWAFINNLDHIALIILISLVGIVLGVIFWVCFEEWQEYGDLAHHGMVLSVIFVGFSLVFMVIGAGANLYSERRVAMESNVFMKYDVDLVDVERVQRFGNAWSATARILSSDDNLNIGFPNESVDEKPDEVVTIVFDENSEPKILPWKDASKEDVDKLLKDNELSSVK